jgi:5-(carboxyamino)imidazole ribonucleotide synthase
MSDLRMSPILPGATIGILGSGQLGRMLALDARNLGYRIAIFSPEADAPAAAVADLEIVGDYLDLDRIREFARQVDVVTFEFENVPSATTQAAAEIVPVRPDGQVLHITQNRLREKTFLRDHGFPAAPWKRVQTAEDMAAAIAEIGVPGVLKTVDFGYDGKGQVKILKAEDAAAALASFKGAAAVYEGFVRFEKELSVVAARTTDGQFKAFPVFENEHANHVLDLTYAPARIDPKLLREAEQLAAGILEQLQVVGLLTVELFCTADGKLVVNELAPRVHNSGHITMDACVTSQFEQQIRAVCGLPLGSTELRSPGAAMVNLLGDVWARGEPDWAAALSDPLVKLHLYGKREARRGRKMGHLNITGESPAAAAAQALEARRKLTALNGPLLA